MGTKIKTNDIGNGKVIRVLPQKKKLNKEVINYFIDQAVKINSKK